MESDINGTILSVLGRGVNGGKTIYDIAFSDGNTYTTFDGTLAGKAQALQGQQVSARVKVAPNPKKPQFTNFYLNDVAPVGQLPPQAQPAAAGAPVAVAEAIPVTPASVTQIPIAPPSRGGMSPEREAKIVKQSSLSTAFGFIGALYTGAGPEALPEAQELAYELAKALYGQVMGVQPPLEGTVSPPNGTEVSTATPESVAAEINSEVAGAVAVGANKATLPWL